MPRLSKENTRKKLRTAVVEEAVSNGFGALSVGAVVRRAKVSAGTVYVHFEDKQDMLQQVYLEIKREFHAIMMESQAEETTAAMIRRMWIDTFDFVAKHPNDFLFLEYGSSARILTEAQEEEVKTMAGEIAALLKKGIDDGTLAQMDVAILALLLVAPAMQLARQQVLSGNAVSKETIDLTFEHVWRSIVA